VSKAIASLGCGPQEVLLGLAARTFRPYAARHGYELHLHTEPVDPSRPIPWSKVPILKDLLARHEVVVWLDADLMILDGRRDLADDLPEGRLMAMVEHHTKEGQMPNSGVWVLRGGDDAVALMDEIWAQEDLIDHRWWENAAICRLLGYSLDPVGPQAPTVLTARTAWLDGRWNAIPDAPAPRPRIRHYPGYATRTRRAFMTRDAALVAARRAAGRW
jgi:galactosyl transferase GMA12/MNN10 family